MQVIQGRGKFTFRTRYFLQFWLHEKINEFSLKQDLFI